MMNKGVITLTLLCVVMFGCKTIEKRLDINHEFDVEDIEEELQKEDSGMKPEGGSHSMNLLSGEAPSTKKQSGKNVREQLNRAIARFNVRKGETYYEYYPEMVYVIITSVGKITDLMLEPNETIYSTPVIGEQIGWKISNGKSGSPEGEVLHIYVKPDIVDLETNFIINTDKRVYRFILKSTEGTYMANVKFTYPVEDEAAKAVEEELEKSVRVNLDEINFSYEVMYTGKKRKVPFWAPDRVFDDGAKMFIYIPKITRIHSLPVVFAKSAKGKTEIVNYRIRGNYLIVDGVFAEIIMTEDVDKKGSIEIVRKDQQ